MICPWKHTVDGLGKRNIYEVRVGVEVDFKGLSSNEEKNHQVTINFVKRLVA